MSAKVYALDTIGTIEHPKLKLNKLMQYFIIADFSQTFFYQNEIASLKYIMNNSIEDIEEECVSALTRMLERYFDYAVVETLLKDTNNASVKALVITVRVKENGKDYTYDNELFIENDMLKYELPHADELYSDHTETSTTLLNDNGVTWLNADGNIWLYTPTNP